MLDATLGEPYGPLLARRLERVARAILLRRGLSTARVAAVSGPSGTHVEVLLPPNQARVQRIVIALGSSSF